jgi:hypothetical protein
VTKEHVKLFFPLGFISRRRIAANRRLDYSYWGKSDAVAYETFFFNSLERLEESTPL